MKIYHPKPENKLRRLAVFIRNLYFHFTNFYSSYRIEFKSNRKGIRMHQKRPLIVLLCCVALLAIPHAAKAATITSASFDKNTYLAGQRGYVSVTVYNDKSDKIRVTELSVTVDYYYTDDTVYIQKFFTNAMLPDEIQVGQAEAYQIPISLPTNIASGYTDPSVEAKTEIWFSQIERWVSSDRATYHLRLYIESPYKQMYETNQAVNTILAITTIAFASAAAYVMFLFTRKPRPITQS